MKRYERHGFNLVAVEETDEVTLMVGDKKYTIQPVRNRDGQETGELTINVAGTLMVEPRSNNVIRVSER